QGAHAAARAEPDLRPHPVRRKVPDHARRIAVVADRRPTLVPGPGKRERRHGRRYVAPLRDLASIASDDADELPPAEIRLAPDPRGGRREVARGRRDDRVHRLGFLAERGIERRPHGVADESDRRDPGREDDEARERREAEHELDAETAERDHNVRSPRMKPAPRIVWKSGFRPGTSTFRRTRLTCTSTRFESPS